MNNKAKRRLIVVGGIVVIAMLVIVAVAGSGGAASSLSIADVLGGKYEGKKVQVTGTVVTDSVTADGSTAVFKIQPEAGGSEELNVRYSGALPATFGAGIVAICTGTVQGQTVECSEMVTKCPSKYESAEGSLTVKGLLDQGESMVGKETSLAGYVRGSINDINADVRFVVESQGATVNVVYKGALDDNVKDGAAVVVTGALGEDGNFEAGEQPALDSSVSEA